MKKILSAREVQELKDNVGFTDKELSDLRAFYKHQVQVAKLFSDRPLERLVNRELEIVNDIIKERIK